MTFPWPGRCLGDKVAELADGRLDRDETERALAHVAVCGRCREALAAQRQTSARLAAAADPTDPPADLMARLRGLAEPTIPEQGGGAPAGTRPTGGAGVRPASAGPGRTRRRRGRVVLASAAGVAAVAVAALVSTSTSALSGPPRPAPSLAPVVDRLTGVHAQYADQLPLTGPRIVTVGYSGSTASSPAP